MFRLFVIWCITLIFNVHHLYSQSSDNSKKSDTRQIYINVKYQYGIVIPHHQKMSYLIEDYSRGVDINIGCTHFGKDNWEKYFNYPELGVGLYYSSLGNANVFGDGYAIYPYVNYNIWRMPRFKASYKVGWGLGYVTKIYSAENNPTNMAIGSHFNAFIALGVQLDYRILNHWSISGSWSFNHFSNGSEKKPNEGINLTSLGIGLKYHFSEDYYPDKIRCEIPGEKRLEILSVVYGARSRGGIYYNSKTYFSGGIENTLLFHKNVKKAFGVGVDFRYYGAAAYRYEGNEMEAHNNFSDFLYSSAFLALHKQMGDVALYLQLGVYLTSGIKPPQPVYPKVGVLYNISQKLVANFGLKASFFAAEYIQLGIGYRFQFKKEK